MDKSIKQIRLANTKDGDEILSIYAYYVQNTTISFEVEIPTKEVFTERIADIQTTFPYLVYLIDGKIIGYAYATKHAQREAYKYSVDMSVYISPQYHGKGIAYALYERLLKILIEQGFHNAYAGISIPNCKSEIFHKKFGFSKVGVYNNAGYKFDKWVDMMYMEKTLQEHIAYPKPIILIDDISVEWVEEILKF